jgi:hypothetical protein
LKGPPRAQPDRSARPPRFWKLHLAAAVIGLAAAALMIAPTWTRQRATAVAEAQAWTITGPPCPQLPLAEIARQPRATKTFGYAGAGFAYAYGHVACAQIHADGGRSLVSGYPVCQFISPGVVVVDTGKTRILFAPGLGRRATVSVENGAARCVMAGRFYGQAGF